MCYVLMFLLSMCVVLIAFCPFLHCSIDAFCHLFNKAFMYVCMYVWSVLLLSRWCSYWSQTRATFWLTTWRTSALDALKTPLLGRSYTAHHQCSLFNKSCTNFWQRVSIACYAERCLSYDRLCLTVRLSVRPSVTVRHHANDSSYDHAVFTGG